MSGELKRLTDRRAALAALINHKHNTGQLDGLLVLADRYEQVCSRIERGRLAASSRKTARESNR